MTPIELNAAVEHWISEVWGHDGGAVKRTAEDGISAVDMREIRGLHGDDAEQVADALVSLCRSLVADPLEES
jgi:hypothetical protein